MAKIEGADEKAPGDGRAVHAAGDVRVDRLRRSALVPSALLSLGDLGQIRQLLQQGEDVGLGIPIEI